MREMVLPHSPRILRLLSGSMLGSTLNKKISKNSPKVRCWRSNRLNPLGAGPDTFLFGALLGEVCWNDKGGLAHSQPGRQTTREFYLWYAIWTVGQLLNSLPPSVFSRQTYTLAQKASSSSESPSCLSYQGDWYLPRRIPTSPRGSLENICTSSQQTLRSHLWSQRLSAWIGQGHFLFLWRSIFTPGFTGYHHTLENL